MELCSHNYLELLKSVHNAHARGFGNKKKKIKEFEACIKKWKPRSILDFGCGKGALLQMIREKYPHIHCLGYDPAVKIYDQLPQQKFDVVFSNDVLETHALNAAERHRIRHDGRRRFALELVSIVNSSEKPWYLERISDLPNNNSILDAVPIWLLLICY